MRPCLKNQNKPKQTTYTHTHDSSRGKRTTPDEQHRQLRRDALLYGKSDAPGEENPETAPLASHTNIEKTAERRLE